MKYSAFSTVSQKIYALLFLILMIFIAPLAVASNLSAFPAAKLVYFTKGWFNYSTNQSLVSNDARDVFVTPDGSHIYVATASGLSVSLNGGIDWKNYSPSAQGSLPSIINSVYASTSGQYIYLGTNQGLALSTDAGAHWVYLPLGASHNVTDIVGNLDGGSAYVATDNGLFITTNFGRTWTRMAVTILCNAINSVYVTNNGQQIYAATNTGLFVSRDTGRTWNLVTVAVIANSIYASTDGQQLYLGTAIGLYISQDSGRTWTLITPQQGLVDFNVQAVYVSNNNQTIYAATKKGLSVSNDQGKTWTTYTSTDGLGSSMVNDVYVSDNGLKIYAATSAGLSTKGLNLWHTVNSLSNASSAALYVTPDAQKIYVSTLNGMAISTNGSAYWHDYPQQRTIYDIKASDDGSKIYVAGSPGLLISTDSGVTWSYSISPNNFITSVAASKDGMHIYAGMWGWGELFQSHDGGKTWMPQPHLNIKANDRPAEFDMVFTSNNGQYVLASDAAYVKHVCVSKNFWQSGNCFSNISGSAVYGSADGQKLYVGNSNSGIFISKDAGNTWTNYGASISGIVEGIFATDDGSKIYLAAMTNGGALVGGISISQDGGATWKNYTTADGLPSNNINRVSASADGNQIYALAQTS